ncbi:hypothetical protein ACP4OV_029234 [Aristida adscensionis]
MDPAAAVLGDIDLLREVLARLPAPEDLVRAAAACRPFLRAARDRAFLRRFRRRHPASCPRVLGCLLLHLEPPHRPRCFPPRFLTTSPSPAAAAAYGADANLSFLPRCFAWDALDCRNGRVLLRSLLSQELAVADPVARGWVALPRPPAEATLGCGLFAADDADSSVFCVVCVSRDPASRELRALVLSSGGEWADVAGVPCQLGLAASTAMQANQSLYWRLEGGERMLAFSTATMELSVFELPPSLLQISFGVVEKGEEGGDVLHLLTMRGFCIEVWAGTRDDANESGMAWRQVEKSVRFYRAVATMINHPEDLDLDELEVICVASGVVFLRLQNNLFSIDLETMKLRMFCKRELDCSLPLDRLPTVFRPGVGAVVYPYTVAWPPSFLTPEQGAI